MATQNQKILQHMREHGGITALEALRDHGVMRLAARIGELRSQGHRISVHTIDAPTRDRDVVARVAQYSLDAPKQAEDFGDLMRGVTL